MKGSCGTTGTGPRLLTECETTAVLDRKRGPLRSVQHELSSGSSTHREGATPTRFGPRPRNRDRMPSFSRMALQKETNKEISRITKPGVLLLLLLLLHSSVLLVASSSHRLCYPSSALLSLSLQPLLSFSHFFLFLLTPSLYV